MMVITYKKGKQDKIHISVDGEYCLTVDEAYFVTLGLFNGKEISDDELEELREKIGVRRAYNYAVSLLARREHSEKELMTKLSLKGYKDGAKAALSKLKQAGYLDDERFAALYAKELQSLKRYGKKRIEQELYRKGVASDIIRDVLEGMEFSNKDLVALIERKYMRYLSDEKGINKTINALVRLGYSYREIKDALKIVSENLEMSEDIYD